MNRRTFLKTSATTAAGLASRPLWGATSDPASAETNQAVLARVQSGVEQHREGDGVIVVRGSDGRALADATVKLEQTRHDFLFGCNCFRFDRLRDPKLEEEYRARFTALFNYATLPFYWASYEPLRGQPAFAYSERTADWCRQHGVAVKGHPLVWDNPAGNPRWLPENLQGIGRLSHARVSEIVARFRGRIDIWDVVNEAVHLGQANQKQRMSQWAATLGATRYVAEHLKLARTANPHATLLVNDYRLDPPYRRLLESLREDGCLLFDAIGLQSHMHGGAWPLRTVWRHCDNYAGFGVPLHFTEATVVSGPRTGAGESWGTTTPALEETQATAVTQFYTTLFAHPAVRAITWWDFSDNGAWQGAAAGFVRKDMSAKPAYDRLLQLVKKEWWTKTEGHTDEKGSWATRAFFGTHHVTVVLPNGRTVEKDVQWQRGQERRLELTV